MTPLEIALVFAALFLWIFTRDRDDWDE